MRSRFFRRLSIGAGFAIGLWLIAEAAVTLWAQDTLTRRRAPIPPTHTDAPYLPGSPWLLWEMTPGTRQEMGATVTVISLGIRGPEILTTKPAGTRRVLVMGDSSVYGHGIDDDKVFSQLLDVQFGPTIEVLNVVVPGIPGPRA